jgi:hypothetical protein
VTSHELARKLLELPDLPVITHQSEMPYEIDEILVNDDGLWDTEYSTGKWSSTGSAVQLLGEGISW